MDADAIPLSGSSFYCSAAADAAAIMASLATTTMVADADATALSGLSSYCSAAATATDSVADADANCSKRFFSSCLKSRL